MPLVDPRGSGTDPLKKNKKTAPALPATDTSVGGNTHAGLGAVVDQVAVNHALSQRAASLHPRLLTENPGMAAEFVLGPTKTKKLANVSLAAYHGYQKLQAEKSAQHEAAQTYQDFTQGTSPLDALQVSPVVVAYTARAQDVLPPEAQAVFAQAAGQVMQMPLGPARTIAEQQLVKLYNELDTQSFLQKATHGAGELIAAPLAAPVWAISKGVDFVGDHVPDVIAKPLDVAQEAVGDTLGAAGTAVQFATRNVEAALANVYEAGFKGQPMHLDYFTSWSEAEAGDRSPLTEELAATLGTTVDDPKLQGLFDVTDMGGDLLTQWGMFEALGAVKTGRTVPMGAGGTVTGETFIKTFGKGVVKDVTKALNTPGKSPRARLVDRFRGVNPSLADELAAIGPNATEAEAGRVIANHIDVVPSTRLAVVEKELRATRRAIDETGAPAGPPLYDATTLRAVEVDQFGAMARQAAEGGARTTDMAALRESIKTEGVKDPVEIRVNEDGTLSRLTGTHRIEAAQLEGQGVPVKWVDEAGNPTAPPPGIAPIEVTSGALDTLRAKEASLVQESTQLKNFEPLWEFPRASRMRPIMRGLGNTRTSRLLNHFFGETRAVDLSKMFDDLSPRDASLVDPSAVIKPPGWATHNFDVLRKTMNAVRVPKELQRAIAEDMFRVEKGQLTYYDWRVRYSEALKTGLTRGGKRVLTPEGQAAIRFSDASVEARMYSPIEIEGVLADGSRITRVKNVLEDSHGNPRPSQPNQLLHDAPVPDMQLLQDASSNLRYADQWIRSKPYIGKVFGALKVPLDWAHFAVFTLPRAIVRPLLLAFRPNLGIKIQLDQATRMWLNGMDPLKTWKLKGVDFDPATGIPIKTGLRDVLPEGDITAMGSVASEMTPGTETVAYKLDTRGLDPTLRPRDAKLVVNSRYDAIMSMAHDELMTRLARTGPEETLAYLAEHPRAWMAEIQKTLDELGVSREDWIASKELEMTQATGGDAALREAIATNRWNTGNTHLTGAAEELAGVRAELDMARETLSGTEHPRARNELNLRIEDLENKAQWLESHPQTTPRISLEDDAAVKQTIGEKWQDGSYKMPDEVIVRRSVHKGEYSTGTRIERARAIAQHANRVAYSGIRWMSKADELLTRGSTMKQVFDRVYHDLIEHGYDEITARETASYRAAYITKDLHYDISARSSLDRKLKDYFWFSPVFREQLTTYLHKIPSAHYWAPGLLLEYGMAHTLVGGLKDMGFITDEVVNADGDTAPYFNIAGHQISVGGMNPVTPGTSSLVPTLSPGAEAILDMTAQHTPKGMDPWFEAVASQFEFDKDPNVGPSFIPRNIMVVAELVGVHIPMDTLSLDAWKQTYNKAEVQSRRWAMSDLASQGIMPPTREALQTDEGYDAEVARYEAQIEAGSRKYELGLGFLHALGAVALPGSIRSDVSTGTTAAGEAYYEFSKNTLSKIPFGTDEYNNVKDAYLRSHPAAFPYSVGTHPGEYGTLGYTDRTLAPDDYVAKAIEQVGYWRSDEPPPEADPEKNPNDFAALSPRRKMRKVAEWTGSPVGDLTPLAADAVGLPQFEGRDTLLKNIGKVLDQYDRDYAYDMPDEQKALVAAHRDYLLQTVTFKYGADGVKVLDYLNATVGQRLNRSGYFTGNEASLVLSEASTVRQQAIANDSSPMYAAVTTGVLQDKVNLYRKVDRLRQANPAFDRQMRYAELGLGDKDGPAGRVATYEYLFFGQPDNAFGYQSEIVKGLH